MSKRIFVALNLCDTSGRNSLSGILRYVNAKCNWQLDVRSSFENYTPAFVNSARQNGYDGIITGYPEASQCLNELLRTDLPVVFNVRPEDLSVPPRQIVKTAFPARD